MANVFIGATGGIGSGLGALLAARGDRPAGLHRRQRPALLAMSMTTFPNAPDFISTADHDAGQRLDANDELGRLEAALLRAGSGACT